MPAKLLIIGSTGQLARALIARADPRVWTLTALDRTALDLSGLTAIPAVLRRAKPDLVINAAAYTAVDRAESEPEIAFAVNRDAPCAIARHCAEHDTPLIHASTDYVFDGEKPAPYIENDAKAPLSIYGRSKSEGEDAILAAGAHAAIVRTSWVYAGGHQNFVSAILRIANERDVIDVVNDQIGAPTWAPDLADACLALGARLLDNDRSAEGLIHFANAGYVSRADFAEAIYERAAARGMKAASVQRIATAERPTPARRPLNSRLDLSRYSALIETPPDWRQALDLYFQNSAR